MKSQGFRKGMQFQPYRFTMQFETAFEASHCAAAARARHEGARRGQGRLIDVAAWLDRGTQEKKQQEKEEEKALQ